MPRVCNITAIGDLDIPNVFENLIGKKNVSGPFESFPGRIDIKTQPRPVFLYRPEKKKGKSKYMIMGCRTQNEVKACVVALEQFLIGVGLIE